jgi:signal transduction histidine kinase/PAS domain-containing protein/ActR/RegA family two-component response regulator
MKKHFGTRNRLFSVFLAMIGLLLLAYVIYNTFELRKNTRVMRESRQEYGAYTRIQSRMREGSDILTEAVRRYVATGDVKYRDEYFREVFDTKNREWGLSLLEQMPENGHLSAQIKSDFLEAMKHSLDLMNMEYTAMRLIATDEELSDPSYPKELKHAQVPPEDLSRSKHEREHVALNILFGDEYAEGKKKIYDTLDKSLSGAAKMAEARRAAATSRQNYLWINQLISMSLFVLCFLMMLFWAERIFSRRTAFLYQMLDSLPLLIFLKDSKTKRYLHGNRTFNEYLRRVGFQDPTGKTDYDLIPAEMARASEVNELEALNKDVPIEHEEVMPGPNGQIRYFRTTRVGMLNGNGKPCLLAMAQEITEERERQITSEATEEALMSLQQDPMQFSLAKILELIRNRLNADYCYLARCSEEEGLISVEPDTFMIRGGYRLPRRISASIRQVDVLVDRIRLLGIGIFDEAESIRVREVFKIQQTAPDIPRAACHIAVRLNVQGAFWGLLAVGYGVRRSLTDIEKIYLQKNARILENAIERKKIYAALAKAKNDAQNESDISGSILNLMPLPCVVKDPANEFRYIRCNKAYASLHHLNPSEMIGKHGEDFYAGKSLEIIRRTDAEAMEKRELINFEDTCLWGECNRRVFMYWKLPITLNDGRTLLFCVAQDVTEIKQKINTEHFRNEITAFLLGHSEPEELLDFVAKRLIETLGCQHVLLHRHDGTRQDWFPDNEHTYCNKCVDCPLKTADPSLFSHNGNVVLNDDNMSDFPLPENCPTRILIARQIFFEGDEWGKIATLFTGDAFESLGFCEELLEQVANVISVCIERKARNMVIKRQNEEVVRINRQLQLARDRAVAVEKSRSYFFSCVSHDIRTPLNAIIGYAELLKKGMGDEKDRTGACDAITMSGRSLLQLISDMIDLARLESDTIVIEPVMTDLDALGNKVLHSFEIAVAGKPVRLRTEWDKDFPYVNIDPKRVWQILFNLLDNAVKFTEKGEVALRFAFERGADAETGVLFLSVSDTGVGMDAEEQKLIMMPFASLAETGRHKTGSGLGISICRHLVDRMNGAFSLRSEPGRGTTFDIRIPDVKFSERTNTFPRPDSRIDFHGKAREGLHILIVDDVPLNISVLRAMLRKNGVTDIVCSVNGKDALDKIRASVKPFDLVLTDLWMPEMDGRVLLQQLRTDPRFQSLNVIAITADVDAKEECMKLGFSDVIFKPVTLAKIVNFLPPPSDGKPA